MKIVNTTPHPIKFANKDGEVYEIKNDPSIQIDVTIEESEVYSDKELTLVTNKFLPNDTATKIIEKIEAEDPSTIIVGSILAAQAYPGRVFALVTASKDKREAPDDRIYLDYKFVTY